MTMLMEPLAPWLRDLNRFITSEGAPAAFIPAADVVVTEAGVTVFMDVPGLTREDIEIELENDTLTIRGERRPPEQLQGGERAWRHVERRFGRFERTLRMNPDAVEASLADGVLTLHVPRPESPRPHRVEIQGGQRAGTGDGGATGTTGGGEPVGAGAGTTGESGEAGAQQGTPAGNS
jgi:HSP20 family protein